MKKTRTWILVADGARAQIWLSEGWGKGLTRVGVEEASGGTAPTRELGSDRPGRVQDSAGSGRHAMEPRVDWHRYEKSLFAKRMAGVLDKGAGEKAFDRLVLVAPPQALGDLRAALGKAARALVTAELDKDLTSLPPRKLIQRLEKITPV